MSFHNGASSGRRSRRSWRLASVVVVLGVAASALIALSFVVSGSNRDADLLATRGRSVAVTIDALVQDAGDQAKATAALFRASDEVTEDEFERFADDIGFTDGMFGLGFVIRVAADELDAFNAGLAADHPDAYVYQVEGIDLIPVPPREEYYPIRYFHSDGEWPAWGFDALTNDQFRNAIERIVEDPRPTASGFLAFPGQIEVDGWAMFEPVYDGSGDMIGIVASAMDLSDVLGAAAPMGVGEYLDLHIVDASAGDMPPVPDGAWTETIVAADRLWRLEVTSLDAGGYVVGGIVILVAGVLVSIALAMAVLAVGARLRQRREMDELRSLDRQKDDFLATVSHELRTPLTSIIGFADALRERLGAFSDTERGEMVDFIADEAKAMEGIVQDLLVVARLQQGGAVPISATRIGDMAREVARIAEQVAIVRSSPTSVEGNAAVVADPARLRQIVRNLFDNAVRHGEAPIEVKIDQMGDRVRMLVHDNGPGVDEASRDELFDRYRSGPNPDGLPTSTGIGLWLSRQLARLMGGELRLIPSRSGATFELTLPAADPVAIEPLEDTVAGW